MPFKGPCEALRGLVDASIRTPLALRYATAAFSTAGFAAGSGEKDKETRYPTTQRKSVIPCVVESFGRIGPQFLALLDKITHCHKNTTLTLPAVLEIPKMTSSQTFALP